MFGLSVPEIFVILVVALLVVGPDKLPEVAKALGKGVRQLQRLTNEVRESIRLDEATSHQPPSPPPPPTPVPTVANTGAPPAGPDGNPPS